MSGMVDNMAMEVEARDPEERDQVELGKEVKSLFTELMDGSPTISELEAFKLFESNAQLVEAYRLLNPSPDSASPTTSTVFISRPVPPRSATDEVSVQAVRKQVQIRPRREPRRQSTSDLPTLATTRTIDSIHTQGSSKRSPSPFRSFLKGRRQSGMSVDSDAPLLPPTPTQIIVKELRPAPRKLRKPRANPPELRIETPSKEASPIWGQFTAEPECSSPSSDRPEAIQRRSWRSSLPGFSSSGSGSARSPSPSPQISPTNLARTPSPLAAFPSSARREAALPSIEGKSSKSTTRTKRLGSGHSSDSYHGDAETYLPSSRPRAPSSEGSPPSPISTRKWKSIFGGGGNKKVPRSDSGRSDACSWEWVSDNGGPASPVSPSFEVFRPQRRPSFSRSKSATSVESQMSNRLVVPTSSGGEMGSLASASSSSPNLTKIEETTEPANNIVRRSPPLSLQPPPSSSMQEDQTPKPSPTLQANSIDFSTSPPPHSAVSRTSGVSLLTSSRPVSPGPLSASASSPRTRETFLVEKSEGGMSSGEEDDSASQYRLPRSPGLAVLGPEVTSAPIQRDRSSLTTPSDSDLSSKMNDSERDDGDETPASSALEDERDFSETEAMSKNHPSGWINSYRSEEGQVAN